MALIGKIREKSGWAVGFITVGLALFIVGSDMMSSNSFLRGNDAQKVGEVSGEKIMLQDYSGKIDEIKNAYAMNTGKMPTENEMGGLREQAWTQIIFDIAHQKEYANVGLQVTEEELTDMMQGKNIHPAIKQSFVDQKTGQFDKNLVINYINNVERMEPKQQQMWFNFQKSLAPDRMRIKYENLIKSSVYVTKAEAKRDYIASAAKVNVKYLYVPFYSIVDSTIKVSDEELLAYVKENKAKYKSEASANLEYVTFPIYPSSLDTAIFKEDLANTLAEFAKTEDDSAFVNVQSDNPVPPSYVTPAELPQPLLALGSNLRIDSVYGPFAENGSFKFYKVGSVKNDTNFSVRASHILFKVEGPSPEAKAAAYKQASDVLARIKKGESFEMLAGMFGTDGTAQQGGDLGWFTKGRMVKQFENAVFNYKGVGLLPQPVETDFGYHLIKVTQPKTGKKFFVASIDRTIIAGEATKDSVYKLAEMFAAKAKDAAGIEAASKELKLNKIVANNVAPNAQYINMLSNPREIVRWAFNEAKDNETSPVFEIDNQFVVAVVKNKYDKDEPNLENLKTEVSSKVRNQIKAKQIIEKLGTVSNLEESAKKYGTDAVASTSDGVLMNSNVIGNLGYDPISTGVAFGLKKGQKKGPFASDNGVVVIETLDKTDAPEIADYTQYKNTILDRLKSRIESSISEAIKEKASIEDTRYKFF